MSRNPGFVTLHLGYIVIIEWDFILFSDSVPLF